MMSDVQNRTKRRERLMLGVQKSFLNMKREKKNNKS